MEKPPFMVIIYFSIYAPMHASYESTTNLSNVMGGRGNHFVSMGQTKPLPVAVAVC